MSDPDFELIRESATAVLLREAEAGFEVLMLQKAASINYGGSWVFPGGLCEDQDAASAESEFGSNDRTQVAIATVLRETQEETGLVLSPDQLQPFSNWLTPKLKIKRYNTLFFVAKLEAEQA